jgi:pimeloyl-ACP methyl ester carboxylesterase
MIPQTHGLDVHDRGSVDDPVAVMIHSTGLNGAEMVDLFGLAIPGYHVVAPDRTNYGMSRASEPGGTGRSNGHVPEVAMIADDAEAIAPLLAGGGHLLGYSYGGIVALVIASRHPDRVRSLTLIEAPAFQLTPTDAEATAALSRFSAVPDAVYDDPHEYFRAFMSSGFGDTFRVPLEVIPLDRKIAAMREQVPWDVSLDLRPIADASIPTLVICGDWDTGFTAVSQHLANELPGRVVQLPGATHFFDDHWGDIVREIESFWNQVDRS